MDSYIILTSVIAVSVIALIALTVTTITIYRKIYLSEPSLYDRLGGVFAISAVVNDFSDALVLDPIAGAETKNPYLSGWYKNHIDRLPGLKFMRTLWLCAVSGGPYVYTPTKPGKCPFSLEKAHSSLHITSEEFDATAAVLSRTLDKFKVPEKEKAEVLSAFAAHKGEVAMTH